MEEHATIIVETVFSLSEGELNAVRVIPHNHDGKKPRGRAGRGFVVAVTPGSTKADALRVAADILDAANDEFSDFIAEALRNRKAVKPLVRTVSDG